MFWGRVFDVARLQSMRRCLIHFFFLLIHLISNFWVGGSEVGVKGLVEILFLIKKKMICILVFEFSMF